MLFDLLIREDHSCTHYFTLLLLLIHQTKLKELTATESRWSNTLHLLTLPQITFHKTPRQKLQPTPSLHTRSMSVSDSDPNTKTWRPDMMKREKTKTCQRIEKVATSTENALFSACVVSPGKKKRGSKLTAMNGWNQWLSLTDCLHYWFNRLNLLNDCQEQISANNAGHLKL